MIKIGSHTLSHGLMLGPMAGYSDKAMRQICREWGAEYTVTEMVSAKAVCFMDKKTFPLAELGAEETPAAIQLFGREPDIIARAAQILLERAASGRGAMPVAVDINMGCPVPKIVNNGEGSALMKDPPLIEKIVRAVTEAIPLPVTVKLRIGFDSGHLNAPEAAMAAEAGGASLICVHGRTRAQMYSGEVDATQIKRVCDSVKIPVIANGDINSPSDALSLLSRTGADGVMIARGAVGNPFIFREIAAFLDGVAFIPPTVEERISVALLQLSAAIEEKGERIAVSESRKQLALYVKGIRGSGALRAKINTASTQADVQNAFYEFLDHYNANNS